MKVLHPLRRSSCEPRLEAGHGLILLAEFP
jgi:hypothetical protein